MKKEATVRDLLASGTPCLFDGATGTELYQQGIFINRCFEEANLFSPHMVEDLHRRYLQAGAQILTANSWGANIYKLRGHNLHDRIQGINHAAVTIAKKVAGDQAFVAGSMGPLGVRLEPWGPTSFAEARTAYKEQALSLAKAGADLFLLETFSDISELREAIFAARDVAPEIPIFAQLMIDISGNLPAGSPLEWAFRQLTDWGADVVGLNCSVGPSPMITALKKIRATTDLPIILQPNAGLPRIVDGRSIYMCTPEYMAEFTKTVLQAGVQFIGGCCGTTPLHIKQMAAAFRHFGAMSQRGKAPQVTSITQPTAEMPSGKERVPFAEKSQWSRKIAEGKPVYTLELLPPQGVNADALLAKAKEAKDAGVDCINLPDGPRASARMSAILTALMIEQRVGIETILHYTCRDRNLLGMQSDMLGAHAIGLRNMLLVTGDPPKMGLYPDATGVFDVDAIGLTNMVHKLNGGVDLGERPMNDLTALSIGVGVNPVHRDFAYEMKRFRYKVEAGAEWAITQPVFDLEALYRFLEFIEKDGIRIPIIAGIWPLVSLRNAEFMNNEVPGVVIPDDIIKKMAKPQNADDAKKVGVEIAAEMVAALGNKVQGIQVSAPFGRVDLALQVIGKKKA